MRFVYMRKISFVAVTQFPAALRLDSVVTADAPFIAGAATTTP
jgi:hypothetical protein